MAGIIKKKPFTTRFEERQNSLITSGFIPQPVTKEVKAPDISPVNIPTTGDTFTDEFNKSLEGFKAAYDANPDIAPVAPGSIYLPSAKKLDTDYSSPGLFKGGALLDDGFQLYDAPLGVLATAGDIASGILQGFGSLGEGLVDLGAYGTSKVADLFGNEKLAESTKNFAKKDHVGEFFDTAREPWKDYSFVGDMGYNVSQGVGQVAGIAGTGGLGAAAGLGAGGQTLLTLGTTFLSSTGSGMSEAYQNEDTTDGEAWAYGLSKGTIDTVTESIFGGLGKGLKSLGLGRGLSSLDDMFAKKLSSKISNHLLKNAVQYGIKATGEGVEEVLAGLGTAYAKYFTYMSDEDIEKLIEDENLLEQFIVGSFTSGIMQGGDFVSSVKDQTDFITGLNQNEEAVVNKEFENRVTQEEQNGNKLSGKDKNKIFDEVVKDLNEGIITTDVIEEVLGGETYKFYQETVEKENALNQELEELRQMKNSDMNDIQTERLQELKDMNLTDTTKRDSLKAQYESEVLGKINGSRLVESYNERARKGQYYEADLTKYDEKQKQVIQKAIDSKILNNTNRTHKFVDMVAKISADKGVLFDFTNNENLKKSGFAVDGKTVNGYVTKDGVTVNIDSRKSLNSVVGHEITHVMEGTELYAEMQNALYSYAKSKNDFDSRRKYLEEIYKNIEGANIDAELTADLVGDYLFTDEKFINHLSTNNKNVFKRLYDEIKYLAKIATAGSKEAREFERVKRSFEKAWKESGKVSGDTKYSVSDKNIKDVSTGYGYGETYFTMSYEQDGKTVGTLEYGEYDGIPNVKMVEVAPEYRRKGIATKLLQELQNKYPDTEINFGMTTPDGTKLLDSITYDVTDEAVVADRQKLKDLQTELNELQEKLDVLYDTENLTEAQEAELHTLGDRWTEVYDSIRDLEKELRGKKSTKTFVKTDAKYSLSDSDGKKLTNEQNEYFKDSKMRDENGNLKVMYHGSQDAGFHTFDAKFSDDDTSFFFVDRNDVAASYSGTTETYEAQTIRTAEDMNRFLESIGYEQYSAVEKNGKFELLENNEHVATKDTAQELYEEFCWYEGVGEGDANYKVYLNLKNPLEIDAKGRPWNKIDAEFSQEVYDKYKSLTAAEKAALVDLAGWEDFRVFNSEIQEARGNELASAYEKMGEDCNIYDLFSVAADSFSETSMRENSRKYLKTRDYAQRAKEGGYDGVIFKNIVDNGGYSNGSEGASTVAIAFSSEQIKSVANEKPTGDPDIRYSLSEDSEGRKLSEEQENYFKNSKVVDDKGNLKAVYHGSPAEFNTFSLKYLGTNGTNEGYGFYFTDSKRIAEGYSKGHEGQQNEAHKGKLFEVYLDIKKPLSDTEVTMSRSDFRKFLTELNNQVDEDGEPLEFLSNYGDVEWEGLNKVLNYAMEIEYDGSSDDVSMVHSVINACGDKELVFDVLRKTTGYDGIIVKEAQWGGDQTIYIAFHPEQIKNVDNFNPTSNPDVRKSLSKEGEQTKQHGKYNVYGEDVRFEGQQDLSTPTKEDAAPIEESVPEEKTTDGTVSKMEQVEELSPVKNEYSALVQKRDALQKELIEFTKTAEYTEENQRILDKMGAELDSLHEQISNIEEETNARQTASLNSLDDADAPPEMDAPYYGEEESYTPDNPFENRDYKDVGNQKVKAYQYENPEVKPFFQAEANVLLGELNRTQRGERYYTATPDGNAKAEYGAESYGYWTGVSRQTTADIAELLDNGKGNGTGYTYAEIEKGLKAIIEDNGKENNACSKRIEFIINDRLMNGYEGEFGHFEEPNQEYLNLLKEKEITAYNDEARKQFFEVADKYEPPEDVSPIAESKAAPVKEQYETIRPKKETQPSRIQNAEPRMKRVDSGNGKPGEKQRKWVGTSTESEAVGRKVLPEDLNQKTIHYQPISNQKTLGNANAKLNGMGYETSVSYFNSQFANKSVSLDDVALGERLIQEAIKRGDTKTAGELIQNVAILGTELGQKVQALSIIKRLTPEGQLGMLQKTVERGKTKGDKAYEGVEFTQEMVDEILSAYKTSEATFKELQDKLKGLDGITLNKTDSFVVSGDTYKHRAKLKELGFTWSKENKVWQKSDMSNEYDQAKLNEAVENVKKKIADQMKVSSGDKVNAWRYLSMLGNPKTHIRNLVSNVAMRGTVAAKNAVARTIETFAPIKNRTKTWKSASEDVKAFAKQTTLEMKDEIMDGGKYSEDGSIKAKRQIFKNKILNGVYEFNSDMLSKEDWWFSKPAFSNSLSEYLTANGIKTKADIQNNPEIVEKAKQYAMEQSQIATFRQYSWLANKINEIEQKNIATKIAVGATLPFKKTPINIAKTALNYSPLGFVKTLTYDAKQVKNGKMEASTMIDHLAQSITGTASILIGYMLAQAGFINGAGEDDKEGEYDYQLGEQAYSVNIGDATFSLSWLSPIAMPLFVGANAYEQLVELKEWNGDVVVETLAQTLDPLSEMSFLSSLDDVLSSYDSGVKKFAGIGESMAQNYLTQFAPTLMSQIAQVTDDTKRSTKVAADSEFKFVDETINKLKYKIPFLRQTLEPSIDIWGNEVKQTEDVFTRAVETFLAPWAKKDNIATEIDTEIKDLYQQTGDAGLIPSIPHNYINYDGAKYEMSAKDYTEYKKAYGQNAYNLMEKLFNTETYKSATSEERADLVNKVYDYARDEAKREYFVKYGVDFTNAEKEGEEYYKENSIKGAIENDMMPDEYEFSTENPEKYKFFNENGITYDTYKEADEDGKRAYTWAYENPGKYKMSKVVAGDVVTYRQYASELYDIKADKDSSGKTIVGSRKDKVLDYINGLDLEYGAKLILFKNEYNADDTYNYDIIDYLNNRPDLSYEDTETILKDLGFNVDSEGNVTWD